MKKSLSIIVAAFFLLCDTLHAQDVPRIISYQGVLVGSDGKPVNDIKNLTITIVDNSGTPHSSGFIHTESFILQGGLFFARLGAPPHSSVQFPILDGQWNLKISDGNPSNDRLVPLYSTVSALNIADNVVTSRKIKDGEVDLQDLAPGNTPGEILKWNGTQWVRGQDEGLRSVSVDNTSITGDGTSTAPLKASVPSGVPIGSVIAYWGNTPPDGWLLCDSSIIPSLYQSLIDFLGSSRTPDLRGMFLRGANTTVNSPSKGNNGDPDEGNRIGGIGVSRIGATQEDGISEHRHRIGSDVTYSGTNNQVANTKDEIISVVTTGSNDDNYHLRVPGNASSLEANAGVTGKITFIRGTNVKTTRVSTETRPKNVYVNYIIKAK